MTPTDPTRPLSAQPMTTAGLQAKVDLRWAWFEAHPNQPMPEGRAEVERRFAAIEAEAAERAALPPAALREAHPESFCHRCGGPNRSWFAPSPLWNEVMRGGDINGPWQWAEIICPTCFIVLAEEAGIATDWRIDARNVLVELQTVTPSGRVWDVAQDLWVDPSALSPAPAPTPVDDLGAAWAEAEAALPDGWRPIALKADDDDWTNWSAGTASLAYFDGENDDDEQHVHADGPTPAAALRALAARLAATKVGSS